MAKERNYDYKGKHFLLFIGYMIKYRGKSEKHAIYNNCNTRLKWYYESRDKVLLRFKRKVEVLALRAQWWWNDARRRPAHGYGVSFLKMLINAVGHYFDGNIYIDIHKGYLPVVFCSGSITILHWYQCGYHRVAILDFWNELKMSFPLQSFGKDLRSTGAGSLCMICRINRKTPGPGLSLVERSLIIDSIPH